MHSFSSFSIGLAVAFVAACGGKVVVDDLAEGAGGASGSVSVGSSSVSSSATSGAGGAVTCDSAHPEIVPPSVKACAADSDCTTENIGLCCTTFTLGVAKDQVDAYNAFEATCVTTGFPCECPIGVGGQETEDGKGTTVGGPPAIVTVACTAGRCMTFTM